MAWSWFLVGYVGFTLLLAAYATHVSLSCRNTQRRADAYKVLKLVWGGATGTTGAVAIVIRLHEVGML